MSFGMTDAGFKPKRLADIMDSLTTKLQNATDPETGEHPFINETADGVLMQITSIIAEELSICWEQAYAASTQFDPPNASGAALRGLVQINGINPSYGSSTQIPMTMTGTPGVVIPAGSRISNIDGTETYQTASTVTIPDAGTVVVNAVCTETGPKNPSANTIIAIQTPIYGWTDATNGAATAIGSDADTDTDLHIKQERATSATSYRQVDAIIAGIINVPGVTFARLYVNKTLTTDARGITGKTMAAVVVGGEDEAIANVMRLKAGSLDDFQGNLTTPVTYTGELGDTQVIDFYRPTETPIYIGLSITVTNSAAYPENAQTLIKQAIVEYSKYDQSGMAGFPPGADVILSRLYTPINSVPGFKVNSLQIGKAAGTLAASDIAIAWNELATFDADNISITVV